MSRIKPQRCTACGKKYIYFDLHWINCEKNPEKGKKEQSWMTQKDVNQTPTSLNNPEGTELDDLLEELWEYGFDSNGDFPTEHKGRYVRVEEAKQAILQWHTTLTEQAVLEALEYLSEQAIEYGITNAEAYAHNTGYDGQMLIPLKAIAALRQQQSKEGMK